MKTTRTLAIATAILTSTAAFPQFDFGGGATSSAKPWESYKLNSKTRVRLNFRNATIDNIIAFFQKQTGVTIVKDPGLTGTYNLTSAKPVSLNEAFNILSTTLSLKNYNLVKEGNLLVIRPKPADRGGQGGPFGGPGSIPTMTFPDPPQSRLKVYPLKYASATQVARVVNEVFQQQGGGGFQFPFGGGGGGQFRFGGGQGGGGFRPGGQGGFPGFGGFNRGQQAQIRASADDFSNSVIINAPDQEQRQVEALINQIDKQTDTPLLSKVYKLQYANASDLVTTVQNILTANAPTGRGGQTSTQQGQNPFFQLFNRNNQSQVSADTRANALVVTTTEVNQAIVDRVVKELDTNVPLETSAFVIPLENARADNVASLLQQAFGTRQGTGNNFRGTGNNTTNRGNNNNRNNNGNRLGNGGGGGLGGRAAQTDPGAKELAVDLEDPNADSGELMTSVGIQGGVFGGGGQFGQNRNNQQRAGQTTGRDAQGRLVNVNDLTGQVTAIPDVNTNSIIVVTTPENADLIRNILNQLDRIPEQVMIETLIVEANLTDQEKMGIEWSINTPNLFGSKGVTGSGNTDFGLNPPDSPDQGLKYSITGGNLGAYVNLFKSDTRFRVLSTPRIFTSNNAEAEINISQSIPYVTSSREDATTGNISYQYSFLDVGIILTVTPRITSNGYVTMDVTQTANDLQGYTDFNAPIVNQRQANTTVSVLDGETVILGGIIRNTVNATTKKVPLLGDIPLLGELFKSRSKTNQKTELLVFLTPRVVRNDEDARRMREEQQKKLAPDLQKSIKEQLPPPPTKKTGGTNQGDIG